MFESLWRRFQQWRTLGQRSARRSSSRRRLLPRLEALEDRLTPSFSNFDVTYNSSGSIVTLTKTNSGSDGVLAITPVAPPSSGGFEQFVFSTSSGTINGTLTSFETNVVAGIDIVLKGGDDQLTIDGTTAAGVVNLPLGLSITGTGGDKTITANSMYLRGSQGDLTINLTGSGSENTTLTDVNVGGAAKITHSGSGTTVFAIKTSTNNNFYGTTNGPLNTWDSLSITNGAGSATTTIEDTDFASNVSISNGSGGSTTTFSDGNNIALLTITGSLSISTNSGQSTSEVQDYNVVGSVNINAGSGAANSAPSIVGLADNQSTAGPLPTFGSVTLGGTAVNRSTVDIDVGTGSSGGDYPASINGGLTINGNGSGTYAVKLNDLTVIGATSMTFAAATSGNTVTILGDQATATFGAITIKDSGSGSNTYNIQNSDGTLFVYGGLTFTLAGATDTVNIGSSSGIVDVSGTVGLTGTSGLKTLTVTGATGASQPTSASLGGLNISLTGTGVEDATFVDTNVIGAATVKHSGSGDTNFTIDTTSRNPNLLNNWNSLSITDGAGTDVNDIYDTNFAGSVSINNGAGGSASATNGGSQTEIHADNYKNSLLNIGGSLTISTTSDQSTTEVYDYNVHGAVSLTSGSGSGAGANLIGLADDQTTATNGAPVIGGAVTITGSTVSSLNQGLNIYLGTDGASGDFPIVLDNNLTVTVNGTGGSNVIFQDVVAEEGTTSVTFGPSTGGKGGNVLKVFGTLITSVFNNFNITSTAGSGANNTINFQDQKGTLQILGTMNWSLSASNDLIDLASDANDDLGVSGAQLDLFAFSQTITKPAIKIVGGAGLNVLYGANAYGNTLFYYQTPTIEDFTEL